MGIVLQLLQAAAETCMCLKRGLELTPSLFVGRDLRLLGETTSTTTYSTLRTTRPSLNTTTDRTSNEASWWTTLYLVWGPSLATPFMWQQRMEWVTRRREGRPGAVRWLGELEIQVCYHSEVFKNYYFVFSQGQMLPPWWLVSALLWCGPHPQDHMAGLLAIMSGSCPLSLIWLSPKEPESSFMPLEMSWLLQTISLFRLSYCCGFWKTCQDDSLYLCVQIRARTSAGAGKWSDPTPLGRYARNKLL